MRELRHRMERELGKESPGRLHVKFGRGGLVDVEFITQALVMLHGARHPAIRRANTIHAIAAIRRAGLLSARRRGRARRALSLPAAGLGRAPALRRPPVRHARARRPHSRAHRQEPRLSFAHGVPRGLSAPHGLGARALRPDRPRALSAATHPAMVTRGEDGRPCSRSRRRSSSVDPGLESPVDSPAEHPGGGSIVAVLREFVERFGPVAVEDILAALPGQSRGAVRPCPCWTAIPRSSCPRPSPSTRTR